MKLGEFLSKDSIAMLFLLTDFALEIDCKNTHIFSNSNKKMPPAGKLLQDAKLSI
ncbi:MAG: hypothetical protein K6A67_01955 [Bacteroidales bacterium]|nr:hypothetical protein [Bacteroidales bacterium]